MPTALTSMYKVILSKQAIKDLEKLKRAGKSYAKKAKELVDIVKDDPFMNPPSYEKLVGDLKGFYSRRINDQHRFVYAILPNDSNFVDEQGIAYQGIVNVLKMWTHYGAPRITPFYRKPVRASSVFAEFFQKSVEFCAFASQNPPNSLQNRQISASSAHP
jgi:Txe/YoeB family toxin of toxin-antitoxin system